ncbi:transcriptional regulator [Prolixibacteraceae bacterium JC049]|nr:transcriptional regulator [Prolixibacteraceae bacterium JC049]
MKPQGAITERMWAEVGTIYDDIIHCEFVERLMDGTLPDNCFAHYLSQDALYLKKDAEALAIVATRCEKSEHRAFYEALAIDGIQVEEIFQRKMLPLFNVKSAKSSSPAFGTYTQFLLRNAVEAPLGVAMAALLPCFWLYSEVGKVIRKNSIAENRFQAFIETYSGDEYNDFTFRFIKIVEEQLTENEIVEEAIEAFKQSAQFELELWLEAMRVDG